MQQAPPVLAPAAAPVPTLAAPAPTPPPTPSYLHIGYGTRPLDEVLKQIDIW
jgi:hypothetical protein